MADEQAEITVTDLSGTRAQAVQRLQVGAFGLGAMILLIGLANIFIDRARQVEASAVPEAASTLAPEASPTAASDPLADAGVVPDLPATPEPQATQTPAPDASPPSAP